MADGELLGIVFGSIGGGIILLLIVACIVCTTCWGCLIYKSLNKLWDILGILVEKMEKRRRARAMRRAREDRDIERGDSDGSLDDDDYVFQGDDEDRGVDTSSDIDSD